MTKKSFWLLLILITTASACRKKKLPEQPAVPIDSSANVHYADYMALKPGNYWIYQTYTLDSINGEAHPDGKFDSAYVEKDTICKGFTYHKYRFTSFNNFMVPQEGFNYIRDSLSYTVDIQGRILFSSRDFTNTFKSFTYGPNASTPDTLYVTEKMGYRGETTTVAAGTFTTCAFRRIYRFPAGYAFGETRSYDYRYAKNIGLITETTGFYTNSPKMYERRLVRYHVQ